MPPAAEPATDTPTAATIAAGHGGRTAQQTLGAAQAQIAENRGAAISLTTAAEYTLLLTSSSPSPAAAARPVQLSARERELVTLVARGRTNAEIAAQLYISIPTVTSHLDRIRDKTGACAAPT